MALENVTHISDLVPTNPGAQDPASQGDDHIRNTKKAIKNTFAKITGAVTVSHTQINEAASGYPGLVQTVSGLASLAAEAFALKTTKVSAGSGLTGGGDLSADRTLSVDGTVVRTSGAQTIADIKTFSADITAKSLNSGILGRDSITSSTKYYLFSPDNNPSFIVRSFNNDNSGNFKDFVFRGDYGRLIAEQFDGDGARLTNLNAAAISTGTVPDARLSGDYTGLGNITAGSFRGNASDTVTNPAHTWASDTNTGMYRASDTEIGFTVNGVKRGGVNNSGWVGSGSQLTGVVKDSVIVTAGNGLIGGGALSASRSLALGTPSEITATSTNSATATSHTHALSEATIRTLVSKGSEGSVGTYAMLRTGDSGGQIGVAIEPGTVRSGSALWYANASTTTGWHAQSANNRPTGTWRCMGFTATPQDATLWLRIT